MSIDAFPEATDPADKHPDIVDSDREAQVMIDDNGDVLPMVADIEPPDNFPATIPDAAPQQPRYERDELDEMADKLGSYALAAGRLGESSDNDVSVDVLRARRAARHALRPIRRRFVSGPQLGEETADHADQTRTSAEYEALRAKTKPIMDALNQRAIERAVEKAATTGQHPEAVRRAVSQRIAAREHEKHGNA